MLAPCMGSSSASGCARRLRCHAEAVAGQLGDALPLLVRSRRLVVDCRDARKPAKAIASGSGHQVSRAGEGWSLDYACGLLGGCTRRRLRGVVTSDGVGTGRHRAGRRHVRWRSSPGSQTSSPMTCPTKCKATCASMVAGSSTTQAKSSALSSWSAAARARRRSCGPRSPPIVAEEVLVASSSNHALGRVEC